MRTAVVILNWNGRKWMESFLPIVLAHTNDADIIVADNASTDDSVEWLRQAHPEVGVIQLEENLGFAGGYNEALARLDHDLFLLLNSDVEVTPGWLKKLKEHIIQHPRMAACQPKIRSYRERQRLEHAGAAGGFIDRNGYPFCRGRIFEVTEVDEGQYDGSAEVFWATGACLLIRREAFNEVDGFDPALFAHMEEIDLCWRLRRRGWTIGYTSAALVYHAGGGALGYGSPRKTYLNFRNSLIVLTKNLRRPRWQAGLIRRLVLDGFAAIKFLLEGHGAHSWQVFRAHWAFFLRLPHVLDQRRKLLLQEQGPDLTGMYHRSIAFDRFILGWKRFTQLDRSAFERHARAGNARPENSPAPQAP